MSGREVAILRPLVVLATLAVASMPLAARADAKRVAVPKFDGKQEALVRGEVMKVLARHGYTAVGASEVAAAVSSSSVDLESDDGFKAVARALGIAAFVTGEVGSKSVRLTVRGGADGAIKADATFAGPANPHKLAIEVGRTFWERLGSAVARGRAPGTAKPSPRSPVAEAEPKSDGDAGDKSESEAATARQGDGDGDDQPRSRRRARIKPDTEADVAATGEVGEPGTRVRWLELAAGGRGFSRNFSFHEAVSSNLREYQLALGPAVVADLAVYPLALAIGGFAANVGLVASIEQAVGTSSQLAADGTFPNGATFPTSMHEFAGGARYRIPLGDAQIGVQVTGGEHAYWFTSGAGVDRNQLQIPNAVYHFVRGGVDGRLALTPDLFLTAAAGYRYVLNGAGPIRGDFPHLTVAGVDADVGAAYAITETIEARVQGGIRRYFYDMHSVAGDTRIAGGAVDQYLSVAALLAVTLDRTP